ncbi:MAG: TIGR03000 domain-containing protein [Zavarzinella sp.]
MYSLVMLAAMASVPETPNAFLCGVSDSKYGGGFWLKHCFHDCCAPLRYGWANCFDPGASFYPTGNGFCCGTTSIPLYRGQFQYPCGTGGCKKGCGKGFNLTNNWGCNHDWCGYDWGIGNAPAYWPSCGPYCGPYAPYARPASHCAPCGGSYAFDSGLPGHTNGVGYVGFYGTGNYGGYGQFPMMHSPSLRDLPPYPNGGYHYNMPGQVPSMQSLPAIPPGVNLPSPGTTPVVPEVPNIDPPVIGPTPKIVPEVPALPGKQIDPKDMKLPPIEIPAPPPAKGNLSVSNQQPATSAVVKLTVPADAQVFVDGYLLKSTGAERSFTTPALNPGTTYTYVIKAYLKVGQNDVLEQQIVTLAAGKVVEQRFQQLIAQAQALPVKTVSAQQK